MSQFALKWVLMHEEVTVAIPGAVDPKQVKTNCSVSELDSIDEKCLKSKNYMSSI